MVLHSPIEIHSHSQTRKVIENASLTLFGLANQNCFEKSFLKIRLNVSGNSWAIRAWIQQRTVDVVYIATFDDIFGRTGIAEIPLFQKF